MPLRRCWCWCLIVAMFLSAGCAVGKKKKPAESSKEEIMQSFARLQESIADLRTGQTEKFWSMLSSETQAAAEKKAKAFRKEFAELDMEEQADRARQFGATPEQIREKLSGYGYVRLMREFIYERYLLMVAAPVDAVKMGSDEAIVFYTLDDAERDKKPVRFVREEGDWYAVLDIP